MDTIQEPPDVNLDDDIASYKIYSAILTMAICYLLWLLLQWNQLLQNIKGDDDDTPPQQQQQQQEGYYIDYFILPESDCDDDGQISDRVVLKKMNTIHKTYKPYRRVRVHMLITKIG